MSKLSLREIKEEEELHLLSPKAVKAKFSKGRIRPEEECDIRTAFERDRDRIIHSKAFRRLKHKTQVFLAPRGDHYRTRLTHTLEVAQIARTIAGALRLNTTLTEAIALGHDLGHTPFGHAGEEVLNEILEGGFRHYEQSLRVVDHLEKEGAGLNLTYEVRMGILRHSKGRGPIDVEDDLFLEAQVVRFSDIIAYVNHDLDDAIRAGIIKEEDLPKEIIKELGERHSKRIDTLIKSIVYTSQEINLERITMAPEKLKALEKLREFLFEKVYFSPLVRKEFEKAKKILLSLFEFYDKNFERIEYLVKARELFPTEKKERLIADYLSGMTDRFALYEYMEHFLPKPWGLNLSEGGLG
ncbi:MAG: deoxyguanosinetriphosphate triphosphohydrolase [Caldimicrobium thiodismutans]|uniref:Deoxyguanosinetriphosphate triphosphohydrolase-like protein n=1 Tax=Caldimicrobium thiodismutans TaxID=1653476 RepID=A0A2N7PLM0_9BACT|nr:MAG: deoxyguanosinetriphosphate triphosphohydrolase [Caldimicrobium thiodismutans]